MLGKGNQGGNTVSTQKKATDGDDSSRAVVKIMKEKI